MTTALANQTPTPRGERLTIPEEFDLAAEDSPDKPLKPKGASAPSSEFVLGRGTWRGDRGVRDEGTVLFGFGSIGCTTRQ